MADNNNFQSTVESLFKGMDSFLTTKTVVGEAIHIGDNILLPLADVSFGIAAGAFAENAKNNVMMTRMQPISLPCFAKQPSARHADRIIAARVITIVSAGRSIL